jgi:hypothetical protein
MKLGKRLREAWRAHIGALDPSEVWDGMLPRERVTVKELAERTGYSAFRTRGALYHLRRQGYAVRLSDGKWMKTDGGQDQDSICHH